MSKQNPLLIVGLAVAGLLLYRSATARPAVAGASSRRTADYFNPVDLAASFGRAIVAATRGVATSEPAGIFAVQGPIVPGTAASGLAGWGTYDAPGGDGDPYSGLSKTGLGDPAGSWSSAKASRVVDKSVARWSTATDAIVAAPVYDAANDFQNNPLPFAWKRG